MVAGGKGWEEGIVRELGLDMYTLFLFKMGYQQGAAV